MTRACTFSLATAKFKVDEVRACDLEGNRIQTSPNGGHYCAQVRSSLLVPSSSLKFLGPCKYNVPVSDLRKGDAIEPARGSGEINKKCRTKVQYIIRMVSGFTAQS